MKKTGCVGGILVFLLVLGISAEAQMTRPVTIGLNFGQYQSSLDYWNVQLRKEKSNKTFGKDSIVGGSLAFGVTPNLRLRVEGSRWTTKVVEDQAGLGGMTGTEDIAITLTPITISGVYYVPLASRMAMYGGVGGGPCLVKVKRTRSADGDVLSEDMTGAAEFFGQMLLGLDIALIHGISVSGEYRYTLGKYVQQEEIAGAYEDHDVALSGSQVGFSLNYSFGPAIESGPSMPSLFGGGRRAIQLRPEILTKGARTGVRSEIKSPVSEELEKKQKELEERRKRAEEELKKLREELEEEGE